MASAAVKIASRLTPRQAHYVIGRGPRPSPNRWINSPSSTSSTSDRRLARSRTSAARAGPFQSTSCVASVTASGNNSTSASTETTACEQFAITVTTDRQRRHDAAHARLPPRPRSPPPRTASCRPSDDPWAPPTARSGATSPAAQTALPMIHPPTSDTAARRPAGSDLAPLALYAGVMSPAPVGSSASAGRVPNTSSIRPKVLASSASRKLVAVHRLLDRLDRLAGIFGVERVQAGCACAGSRAPGSRCRRPCPGPRPTAGGP